MVDGMPIRVISRAVRFATLCVAASAGWASEKVLVLGDSLSEEYYFQLPFSAPSSDPTRANTRNWIEILADRRADDLDFGEFKSSPLAYSDLRNGGFAYNWGVPGAKATDMVDLIHLGSPPSNPSEWPEYYLKQRSLDRIKQHLDSIVDLAVVFLGGNDVNSRYGEFYQGTIPETFLDSVVDDLREIVRFIRGRNAEAGIVLVNVPDVGITPKVAGNHPDPVKRAAATDILADLNGRIAAMAAAEGAVIADLFGLTRLIGGGADFHLNGRLLVRAPDPENPPDHLFTRDGFHASTSAQALIANVIVEAINQEWSTGVELLAGREILAQVLDLDPDQPWLDWLASHGLEGAGPGDNPHGDAVPLGIQFAFGLIPGGASVVRQKAGIESGAEAPGDGRFLRVFWSDFDDRHGYLEPEIQWSPDLIHWQNMPLGSHVIRHEPTGIETWLPIGAADAGWLRLSPKVTP